MCEAINLGGREFACGGEYAQHWLLIEGSIYQITILILYCVGLLEVLRGKTGRRSKIALLFLTLLLIAVVATSAFRYGDVDMP